MTAQALSHHAEQARLARAAVWALFGDGSLGGRIGD